MNYSDYLAHHGIKGQKWGVRRYQNPDGSYTNAGKSRYGINTPSNKAAYKSGKKKLKDRLYSEYDRHENAHDNAVISTNKKYGQLHNNRSGENKKLNAYQRKAYNRTQSANWDKYEADMITSRAKYRNDLKMLKRKTGQDLRGKIAGAYLVRQQQLKNQHYTRYGKGTKAEIEWYKKAAAKNYNTTLKTISEKKGIKAKGKTVVDWYINHPSLVFGSTGTSRTTVGDRFDYTKEKKKQFNEWY